MDDIIAVAVYIDNSGDLRCEKFTEIETADTFVEETEHKTILIKLDDGLVVEEHT